MTSEILIKPALSKPSSIKVEPTNKDSSTEVEVSQECSQTVSLVLREIKSHGVEKTFVSSYKKDVNQTHYGNPTNRKARLRIALKDSLDNNHVTDAQHIIASDQLAEFWANKIASSCLDLAVVEFGRMHTSEILMYAIQKDGKMQLRACHDYPMTSLPDQLPWDKGIPCGM